MARFSLIEWCMHTANLWWGCEEVHAGCAHCYARVLSRAKGKATAWQGERFATKAVWKDFLKWQVAASRAREIHRVFTGSMMDIFEKSRPVSTWQGEPTPFTTDDLRRRYFEEVVPATPNLLHLCLTKRRNIAKMVPSAWLTDWPANVMTGASVSDQATAETLVPQLLRVPGPHFLSVEPLLASLDVSRWLDGLDWIIVGGESGPGARPCDVAWIRAIVRHCREAGVPVFVKQLGSKPIEWTSNFAPGSLSAAAIDAHLCAGGSEPDDECYPIKLRDAKGGDPDEWPVDLRVRELPAMAEVA